MYGEKLHIYEENVKLFWGLLGLITIAGGAYLLADAFFAGSWQWAGIRQISSLVLFAVGFYAIVRLTEPLYNFVLFMEDTLLNIEIWQGSDTRHGTKTIRISNINELKIMPHSPRKEGEALFDFSTNYHLLYRASEQEVYQDVISLSDQSFTLKLKDIQKIIGFIKQHNQAVDVEENYMISKL